jgi:hypothetical protein
MESGLCPPSNSRRARPVRPSMSPHIGFGLASVDIAAQRARGPFPEAIWPRYLNFRLLPMNAGRACGVRP